MSLNEPLQKLTRTIATKQSALCVGLDSDMAKLPARFLTHAQPQLAFNRHIIEQTAAFAVSYKLNTAFYEARGAQGWAEMAATVRFLKENYPDQFVIADAKRADIGSTNHGYVTAFFDEIGFDAVTLHPYLGKEALQPFLDRADKVCIILAKTSNPGGGELQDLMVAPVPAADALASEEARAPILAVPLWKYVAQQVSQHWNTNQNCMLVVGATYPQELAEIRAVVGEMPFLVPGVGTQGGDMATVVRTAATQDGGGVLINVSRDIIFSDHPDEKARQLMEEYQRAVAAR